MTNSSDSRAFRNNDAVERMPVGEEKQLEEQRWLAREALEERRTDGGYNTTIPVGDCFLWRVSKGDDYDKRARHLEEWMAESDLTEFFGKLGVAPKVVRSYADTSKWLVSKEKRVALLQRRYTEDLYDALYESHAKTYLGNDAHFGKVAGNYITRRCCQMGAVCLLHGDLKPENILILLKKRGDLTRKVSVLDDLRIIDFDPQFLYAGCECVKPLLLRLHPRAENILTELQTALFAILNLALVWIWFEVDVAREGTVDPAVTACHSAITVALRTSKFPLDKVAHEFPQAVQQLERRLNTWDKNYRKKPLKKAKKSGSALAVEDLMIYVAHRFTGLRARTFNRWEEGPVVAGIAYKAPSALCCGHPTGECGFEVKGAQRRLALVLEHIPNMTCAAETAAIKAASPAIGTSQSIPRKQLSERVARQSRSPSQAAINVKRGRAMPGRAAAPSPRSREKFLWARQLHGGGA